jgi:hypothetical protein
MNNESTSPQEPEKLLVEMSVTLNNLCRWHDEKNEDAMKSTMNKAYELSHKGISHLMQLDKLTDELADCRQSIAELIEIGDELCRYEYFNERYNYTAPRLKSALERAKALLK